MKNLVVDLSTKIAHNVAIHENGQHLMFHVKSSVL